MNIDYVPKRIQLGEKNGLSKRVMLALRKAAEMQNQHPKDLAGLMIVEGLQSRGHLTESEHVSEDD